MIKGKTLFFRAIEEADLPLLVEWMNDPEISRLVGGWSYPLSLHQQAEWFKRSSGDTTNVRWMVVSNEGEPLGLTGLWSIDYRNRNALTALKLGSPAARGRGYGTDAIMTLMAYAFYEVGLHRLWGEILTYNLGSYRAYVEKCGWRVEGINRSHVYRAGEFYDQLRVGILASEFAEDPAARDYLPRPPSGRINLRQEHVAVDSLLRAP